MWTGPEHWKVEFGFNKSELSIGKYILGLFYEYWESFTARKVVFVSSLIRVEGETKMDDYLCHRGQR